MLSTRPRPEPTMELCDGPVVSHDYDDARRVMSQCWIFTKSRGLRAMTLHGNGSSMALDGQHLFRWCILDDGDPSSILGYLYCAESPSPELRQRLIALARARFAPSLRCSADSRFEQSAV
jgi:hypothetical protein